MEKLAQGAEAILWLDKQRILKERLHKNYRLPEIDEKLRKFRTRREAKVLQRLEAINFPAPHLQDFCDQRMAITMDFIQGQTLKNFINNNNFNPIADSIGKSIADLHHDGIIHGDLTTSNMIMSNQGIKFIDFGLSQFSEKVEDKAVDLFLLDRALESTHTDLHPAIFEKIIEAYSENNPEAVEVLERFNIVKSRGRNKKLLSEPN